MSTKETYLWHHFDDLEQQHEATSLGMWTFLATEVLIFGGLLTGYTVYRARYPLDFAVASRHLNIVIAAVNTVVLLTSSLTIALSGRAVQTARRSWFSPDYYTPIEAWGLYWHFVDIVWIFLLPLLYLVGTHTR